MFIGYILSVSLIEGGVKCFSNFCTFFLCHQFFQVLTQFRKAVKILCFFRAAAKCTVNKVDMRRMAQKRPRAFVSQKLFFFGLPLGLMTYRERSRAYAAE